MAYETKKEPMKKEAKKPASGKMTDKQKQQLKSHMEKHKDLQDLTPSQLKSHRMKMMVRLRKGMSMASAHKDIMK
tara:strand:- start:731 stop:955 length:225 start_codon:yes stop_codon:yes gene_type:complete